MDSLQILLEGSYGAVAMILSGLLAIVAWQVWLPHTVFSKRWWWAFLVFLLVIIGPLITAYLYWPKAKIPFLVGLSGWIVAIAIFLARMYFYTSFCGPGWEGSSCGSVVS